MYPYLFLVRDRVYLTRLLACLIDQLQSLAPSGHVVDIVERYDDEMTDRVISLLDASMDSNTNGNGSGGDAHHEDSSFGLDEISEMSDAAGPGNQPGDGSPFRIHRSKNSAGGIYGSENSSVGTAPGSPGLFRRPPSHLRLYLLVLKVTRREDGVERTIPRTLVMRGKSVHLIEDYETMWLPWGLTAAKGGVR